MKDQNEKENPRPAEVLAAMPKPISPSEQRGHAGDEECEGGADDSRKNRGEDVGRAKEKVKRSRSRKRS